MRLFITTLLLSFSYFLIGQTDTTHTIKLHFLYGSKPLKKYKNKTETKYFGGIHGGHVSIELDSIDYGFSPSGKVHIFARRKKHSQFTGKHTHNQPPYPQGYKVVTFLVPVTPAQYDQIQKIQTDYCSKPPYDYAFFGMRCSASAEDILGQVDILKKKKRNTQIIRKNFYPKKLRKRMFKLAKERNYTIIKQEGRPTRRWEKD